MSTITKPASRATRRRRAAVRALAHASRRHYQRTGCARTLAGYLAMPGWAG